MEPWTSGKSPAKLNFEANELKAEGLGIGLLHQGHPELRLLVQAQRVREERLLGFPGGKRAARRRTLTFGNLRGKTMWNKRIRTSGNCSFTTNNKLNFGNVDFGGKTATSKGAIWTNDLGIQSCLAL